MMRPFGVPVPGARGRRRPRALLVWSAVAAALLGSVLAGVSHAQQPPQPPPGPPGPPVVIMSGEAVLRVAPDRAFVDVSVETRARGPKEAQQQNAATMATVQEKLRGARLAADAVRTTSYDLQQEADYVNGKRVPRGYLARHSLEIRVDDIERVGEIVDLTVASGVANVSDVRFDLKQRDAVERDALKQAVADALARAEAAASGAGRRVERVLRVEEQRGIAAPRPMVLAMRADAAPPETSIAPGVLEIHAAVTLTAEIR